MRTFETQGDGKEREEEAALAARANRSDRDLGLFPLWPSLRTQLGHLPRSESGQEPTLPTECLNGRGNVDLTAVQRVG